MPPLFWWRLVTGIVFLVATGAIIWYAVALKSWAMLGHALTPLYIAVIYALLVRYTVMGWAIAPLVPFHSAGLIALGVTLITMFVGALLRSRDILSQVNDV